MVKYNATSFPERGSVIYSCSTYQQRLCAEENKNTIWPNVLNSENFTAMAFFSEEHLNWWTWIWILFACFAASLTRLACNWGPLKTICNSIRKHPKDIFTANVSTCTSLSCVRCSASLFSTENLLGKWSVIEKELLPGEDVRRRIKKGLLRNHNFTENSMQAPSVLFVNELPSKAWYTVDDFPEEVSVLESDATFEIFMHEFLEIYQDLSVGWVSNKVPSGGWYLFHLFNQGVKIEDNCRRCPRTMELIERLPLFLSGCAFGNVMFSVLLPKTVISRHCGPSNVRIRCHIPLEAPEGYFIAVAGKESSWKKRKVLIFDDSFYHKVYHCGNGTEPRVVLMVDFWHPCLTFQEKQIITSLFSLKPSENL